MQFRLILAFLLGGGLAPACWATEIAQDYSFGAPSLSSVTWGGVPYTRVSMPGATSGGNPDQPRLPAGSAKILIPYGEAVTGIQVTDDETLVGTGYLVEPVALPFAISIGPTEENIPHRDETIYNSSDPFPAARYMSLGTHGFRGYDILMLRLEPTKYIPPTGALYYYPTLHVTVQTAPASGRNTLLRGLTADKEAAAARVDNPGTIGTYPAETRSRNGNDYDLLILTTQAYMDAQVFESLQSEHEARGTRTLIQAFTGSTWQEVRSSIQTAYSSHNINFALIGGGDDVLPAPKLPADDATIPADFYLGCLEPNPGDRLPCWTELHPEDLDMTGEVYIGRAAADSAAEVTNFVTKTLAYLREQHAHLGSVLQAGEFLGVTEAEYASGSMDELIGEAWGESYPTVGIPSGPPYAIDRLYDAEGSPGYLWSAPDLLARMDRGVHWINHLGHGQATKAMKLWAAPYATMPRPCGAGGQIKSDIEGLTSGDYFFVYSQACEAGWFDGHECIAESLTTKSAHGAFAVIMNGRTGWDALASDGASPPIEGPAQRYHRLFWNGVFNPGLASPPQPLTYGTVNQWSKEAAWFGWTDSQGSWGGWGVPVEHTHMRWSFYELNLFGDPSLLILKPQSP